MMGKGALAAVEDNTVETPPTLYWVAAYLMQRVFAGHEEGGWYADIGTLVSDPDTYQQLMGSPAAFLTEDGAEAHADRMRIYLPSLNADRRPLHSVLSNGIYDVLVIAAPILPSTFPDTLPNYAERDPGTPHASSNRRSLAMNEPNVLATLAKLPPECFVTVPGSRGPRTVRIVRGVPGYTEWETTTPIICLNAALPVPPTAEQIAAMLIGSMFGWHLPGAEPNLVPAHNAAQAREDAIEPAIHAAGSIGSLERLAGVGQTKAERTDFLMAFCRFSAAAALTRAYGVSYAYLPPWRQPRIPISHSPCGIAMMLN